MDFSLTEEQQQLRRSVREFAESEIAPHVMEWDEASRFPAELIPKLAELGLLGVIFPEQYGGAGLDHVSYSLVIEELAVECASTATIISAHSSLGSWPILGLGTGEQRDRYLPKMATGEWIGCFALTEPQAGSDAAGQRTRAVRDGDNYVINGTKNFITNGPEAGVAIVFANTDPSQGHRGISAFIAETSDPAYQVVRIEDKMGIRGSHSAQLSFSDLRVPLANLIGKEGDGFKVAMKTLDGGRIGIASQAIGIARASLEASLRYAQERQSFGKPIANYQAIQWKLADMAVEIDAARLLTHRAATLKDAGQSCTMQSAMAKVFAAETAMKAATEAIQVHGGYGYTKEFKVERYFRDAKITEIYEGTSEIQRLVISSHVLEDR